MEPQWFAISDIPYDKMWQDDQMWLPLVLQNKKIRAAFNFDEHDDIVDATISVVPELES